MKEQEENEVKNPAQQDFTPEEIEEIQHYCMESEAVKKLADRYALIFSDPAKSFYGALAFAAKQIENHIFNGTINTSDKKQRALMDILYDGATYYKTLEVGKGKSGNTGEDGEIKKPVKENVELPKIKPITAETARK